MIVEFYLHHDDADVDDVDDERVLRHVDDADDGCYY